MHCFTGCSREDILAAVGLDLRDIGPDKPQPFRPSPYVKAGARQPAPRPEAPKVDPAAEAEAAAKRADWPTLEPPTSADLRTLASVRGIAEDGLRLAVARGILWTLPNFRGHRAWAVTDSARQAAQARRLDGLPWPIREGATVKALSLPGTRAGWPVGLGAVAPEHRAILLCEGGPDLMAAHVCLWAEGREADAAAVALLGAKAAIAPDALPRFAGKRVRILAHADPAGQEAARTWGRALRPVAESLEVLTLGALHRRDGAPVKDLNDALDVGPDAFESARILWAILP
ncbi:MAG: hypothetical protein ACKO3N_17815 [Verrucomicrobiota bacterium]